jgi:hypothetical protein
LLPPPPIAHTRENTISRYDLHYRKISHVRFALPEDIFPVDGEDSDQLRGDKEQPSYISIVHSICSNTRYAIFSVSSYYQEQGTILLWCCCLFFCTFVVLFSGATIFGLFVASLKIVKLSSRRVLEHMNYLIVS